MEEQPEIRRPIHWYTYVGDFLNTLKAFIGTNYQALPFAFANSGLAVGVAGVFVIATLTDHCCQLLVKSKTYIIEKACAKKLASGKLDEEEVSLLRERLQLVIGYGDVGQRVFGKVCRRVVEAAVLFTQFITCLIYFVFIANTITEICPLKSITVCNDTNETHPGSVPRNYAESFGLFHSSPRISDLHLGALVAGSQSFRHEAVLTFSQNDSGSSGNSTDNCTDEVVSTSPDLRLLVLVPLPIFLCTSLIRNVRYLAPFSSIATVALGIGAFSVLGFLIHGFKVGPFEYYQIMTLPIFLCQLISAYEGIGCILPIQSSMVGCRRLFPRYLHANIYLIFLILCTFGILGYLRYGDHVSQIIVKEIQQHTILSIVVDITLIISVLFTYPLQCYPVIEITESCIFGGRGASKKQSSIQGSHLDDEDAESTSLLRRSNSLEVSVSEVSASVIDPKVSTWKRNLVRIILTLIIAGLAVVLRNYFAYLAAFSGAVGSSLLAFILPCMIDIRLRYGEMSRLALIKNVVIIVFTVIISILGVVAIIVKVAQGQSV